MEFVHFSEGREAGVGSQHFAAFSMPRPWIALLSLLISVAAAEITPAERDAAEVICCQCVQFGLGVIVGVSSWAVFQTKEVQRIASAVRAESIFRPPSPGEGGGMVNTTF